MDKKINVVVVGLMFGGAFVKIYKEHPAVGTVGLCDADAGTLKKASDATGIRKTYASLGEALGDGEVDAVHLVTPIPLHEEHALAVLGAGKHCACTVPMATSVEGIGRIKDAVKKSGKNYMMMETALYTYQILYVRSLIKSGEFGRVQFMRGSHYQDMSGWPDYWDGLPPMWYGTHAIAPMAGLAGARIKRVFCFGSGSMDRRLHERYGNPFPVESALFEFENGLKAEATRTLFETAREYQEGLSVYGSKMSFEWGFRDMDDPYVTRFVENAGDAAGAAARGKRTAVSQVEMPNFAGALPEPIRRFTVGDGMFDPLNPQDSLSKGKGGGHHGSHPHLVDEFLSSIAEGRKPYIDENLAGNITAAGVRAHESAMMGGALLDVPY